MNFGSLLHPIQERLQGCLSDQIDDDIWDAMSDVNWDRSSSSDISDFTDVVTSFIDRQIDKY